VWGEKNRKLIYLRLSNEDLEVAAGAENDSFSIGSQRLCIQQYIEAHPDLGLSNDFEELIDNGYSRGYDLRLKNGPAHL